MADTPPVKNKPTSGQVNGQLIADRDGVVWEYNADADTWINKGVLHNPPIVSSDANGLITPEIYRKLKLLSSLKNNGVDFNYFKIKTSNSDTPYFYYFNSSGDLIKFIPEAQNKLRIEVDKARLAQRLLRDCCVGPVGPDGSTGKAGIDGKAADLEVKQFPTFGTDNKVSFSTTVETPLDTDISVRFFNAKDEEVIEFTISLDSQATIETLDDVTINLSSIDLEYTQTSGTVSGEFVLESNTEVSYFKARQKGPTGADGKDGTGFLEVVNQFFDDESVNAEEALVTVRKSGVSNNILFTKIPIFSKVTVSSLSGTPGLPIDDIKNAKYVGLKVTTDDCKDIGLASVSLGAVTVPELDLAEWTPHCGCVDTFRYNISKLDWFKRTLETVPFKFAIEPAPPEQCCQEDFYWCPNAGDLCTITGSPTAPKRLPIKSSKEDKKTGGTTDITATSGTSPGKNPPGGGFLPCLIYDQNEIDLQGEGVQLPSIIGQGEVVTRSVITDRGTGKADEYVLDIAFESGQQFFAIVVDLEIGHPDGSFEGGDPFSGIDPIVIASEIPPALPPVDEVSSTECVCPIHTTMILTREDGFLSELNPGVTQDMRHDTYITPETRIERRSFVGTTATGSGADLQLRVAVNDFGSFDCCLPYALKITVVSEAPESDIDDTPPATSEDGGGGSFFGPPSGNSPPNNPITTPAPEIFTLKVVNPPDSLEEPTPFVSADNLDVPVVDGIPYRRAFEPTVTTVFNAKLDDMYTVQTSRADITLNGSTLTDKIIIKISQPTSVNSDVISSIEPFNALDPAMSDTVIKNTTELVFEKNASFLEDGPLGTGYYFLQFSAFSTESRIGSLKTKFRTDEYDGGFMFVSGSTLQESISDLIIISNLTSWTVNRLNQNIIGYGSQWINTVNQGVQSPGDGLFQFTLNENDLLKKLFGEFKVDSTNRGFITAIYNPFGCAEINIPETINSMVGAIVGGRDEAECDPPSPPIPPPFIPQTATISFSAASDLAHDLDGSYGIDVELITDDGEPLKAPVTVDVVDSLIGTGMSGQEYTYSNETVFFPIGTPSGSIHQADITLLAYDGPDNKTVILDLELAVGATVSPNDRFTLVITSQGVTLSWDAIDASIDNDSLNLVSINVTMQTSDGNNLEEAIILDVGFTEITVIKLIDWDFSPDPGSLSWPANTTDGTIVTFDVGSLASGVAGSINVTLDNVEGAGASSATYVFTIAEA